MTKKVAYCAMLTALAMIFGYVEALIPFGFGIPGIKLGIANIVIVLALYMFPAYQVFMIQLARIVLVSFLFGNISMMIYSLAGGILSFLVMLLLKKTKEFSVTGVSIAGGVSHNIAQILVAVAALGTGRLAWYLPALLVSGVAAGVAIGAVGGVLTERIKI